MGEKAEQPVTLPEDSSNPTVTWVNYSERLYGASVRLAEGTISGTFTIKDTGVSAYIDMFHVSEDSRGQGIGTKLLMAFTSEMKAYGADSLDGHVTSLSALKTRAKVFGKENLQFYNHTTGKKLDITYEELLKDNPNINVIVDLSKIDTTDWPRPIRTLDIPE